jgi:hypothetical protein
VRALTGASGLSTPSRWLWGAAPATPSAAAAAVPASPAPFTPAAAGGGPRRPPRVPASAACAAPAGGAVTAPDGDVEGLRQKVHKLRGLLLCANREIERLSTARRAPEG